MNNKNIFSLLLGISVMFFSSNALAQNEVDALRYSTMFHGGTARFIGMGGAFTALGSDISSANQNPAGLGLYRSSDINLTTTFDNTTSTAKFLGQSKVDHTYDLQASSMGVVFSMPNSKNYETGKGQLNTVVGVTFSQVNSYNSNVYAEGRNETHSFLSQPGNDFSNLSWDIFFESGILFMNNGTAANDFDIDGNYQIKQQLEHRQYGTLNDFNFSIGFNESNKLYYGLSVGVVSMYHVEDWELKEDDDRSLTEYTKGYIYNNYFVRSGMGVNFKAGVMYQVNSRIKASFAIHTPTFMSIEEDWDQKLYSSFDDSSHDSQLAAYYTTAYNLATPTRFLLGASYLLNRMLILGIDYETAAYNTIRLDSDTYSFSDENGGIKDNFTLRHAIRVGTEVRFGVISLRGGGFYYTTPFKSGGEDMATLGFAGGIGFRSGNFYTDIAYQNTMSSRAYYINGTDGMRMDIDELKNRFYATFGFRF